MALVEAQQRFQLRLKLGAPAARKERVPTSKVLFATTLSEMVS